ncbi:MAG TPA: PD-(D/E)XK nuclease family protein, partial [Anaeromyxobacteraceae bacterium]|nr:PD-(D/E)XK nuclease family protein [Anaeromyxobacteraceae bacterium]
MPVLCLVPTSLRARRAARRLCDAQGGTLLGSRLATPEGVAAGLLAAAGDRRPVLTPLAAALLAREAAAAAGPPFDPGDPDGGLSRALERTLAELRAAELGPEDASAAAGEVGGRAG